MLNYTSYVNSLGNLFPVATTDLGFQTAFPNIVDDAEQYLYRTLDLLNTVQRDSSAAFTPGTRSFALPATNGTFYVVNSLYAITPAGQTSGDLGTRNYLTPASRDFCDATFPSSVGSGVPQYFSMTTQTSLIVAPWPDQAYQAEVVGTIRPLPMATTNVTTLLSVYFPDLWIAALMVFGAAYQQNFGAASVTDNPQMAVNWKTHLADLLASAQVEEARKKFTGQGWSSKQPADIATPPRT